MAPSCSTWPSATAHVLTAGGTALALGLTWRNVCLNFELIVSPCFSPSPSPLPLSSAPRLSHACLSSTGRRDFADESPSSQEAPTFRSWLYTRPWRPVISKYPCSSASAHLRRDFMLTDSLSCQFQCPLAALFFQFTLFVARFFY